tara:strand:+ start:388 stop:516 length:129 start_codon:yes stop_codon:yes gene_type:complete
MGVIGVQLGYGETTDNQNTKEKRISPEIVFHFSYLENFQVHF